MTLVKSISGIRGTVGGALGDNLTPVDVVKFAAAYAAWLKKQVRKAAPTIVVGRDARLSGDMMDRLVTGTLTASGCNVLDLGLATTPTTEIAVTKHAADGGIIITASHNPRQWNALKLLNGQGEFLNKREGEEMLAMADRGEFDFVDVDMLGRVRQVTDALQQHIEMVCGLQAVNTEAIRRRGFRVAIDGINSVGGLAIPALLEALGVKEIYKLNCIPDGCFAHNPEPLPEHLNEIAELMRSNKLDVGFVVDPDVDRLAIVCENGDMFGEEYTLVSVADYILSHQVGNTVSNLSSTRALRDVTQAHGGSYAAAAVGEVNVVTKMKETGAIIGGEGNGGVIYPAAHYGRDALVGVALFLSLLAERGQKPSELRRTLPNYVISKNRLQLTPQMNVNAIFAQVKAQFASYELNDIDGVKIDFPDGWVHLRTSNTEPIMRVYAEAHTRERADELAKTVMDSIQ